MQKRTVHLTFDLERDYAGTGEYIDPPSFEGIKHNVPRVLDEMHEHDASGTFFLTPEVLAECEDLVREIRKRNGVGLHSHVHYQPEFRGWESDGDCLKNYTPDEKKRMTLRDVERWRDYVGDPSLFRIGRLEPDHTVLKVLSESGCVCDSSYHRSHYNLFERVRTRLLYDFREIPVDFHLFGLRLRQLVEKDHSVVLLHPLTPPGKSSLRIYDEEILMQIIRGCPEYYELKGLGET